MRFKILYLAAALCAGGAGGYVAAVLRFPLPWMIGAMIASFLFAAFAPAPKLPDGSRPVVPRVLQRLSLVVIGVYLGSQFAKLEDLPRLLQAAPVTIGAVLFYSALCAVVAFVFLSRFLRVNAATAYCAAVPGGLAPILGLAAEHRADVGVVALVQSMRVAMVILAAPFAARALTDISPAGLANILPGGATMAADSAMITIGVTITAMIIGAKLGGIGGSMLPALVLSSAGSYFGWMVGALPAQPLAAALVGLGTYAGMSLANLRRAAAGKAGLAAFISGATMMLLAGAFAFALSMMLDIPLVSLWLALAPGGIGEMALTAMEIGAAPHWILLHHLARIAALLLLSPLILRALAKGEGKL